MHQRAFGEWWFRYAVLGVIAVTTAVLVTVMFIDQHIQNQMAATEAARYTAPLPTLDVTPSEQDPPAPDLSYLVDYRFAGSSLPGKIGGLESQTVNAGSNRSPLAVADGALSHGAATSTNAAGYLQLQSAAAVTAIGADVRFTGNGYGSVALVAWKDSLPETRKTGGDPTAGIHVVANAQGWHIGVFDGSHETVLLKRTFTPALTPGTTYKFDVRRSGNRITVYTPQGSGSVSDARVGSWTGAWPTWELYEFKPGDDAATISAIRAK